MTGVQTCALPILLLMAFDRASARKFIESHEEQRASYYDYYTGKKWGHSESYDLCINSSHLGIEETEKFIAEFIRKKFGLSD